MEKRLVAVMAADVAKISSAKTVQGSSVKIDTANGVKVDNANVVTADIVAHADERHPGKRLVLHGFFHPGDPSVHSPLPVRPRPDTWPQYLGRYNQVF